MLHVFQQTGNMQFTARTEKAGKKNVPASTFWLEFAAPNDFLNQFDPDLKASLYRRPLPAEGDAADQADTRLDDPNYLPRLRHPDISSVIELKGSLVGATMTIHHGMRGKSDIEVSDCTVDSYRVDPQDGGTVRVKFRVNCKPDKIQWFYDNNGQEVCFSITPPASDIPEQGKLVDQHGQAAEVPPKTAGDPFAGSDLERPEGWPFPSETGGAAAGDVPPVDEEED